MASNSNDVCVLSSVPRRRRRSLGLLPGGSGRNGLRMRHRAADFGRRLVFAQAFINDLPQQIVVGPGEKFDFGDEFGPHPMHAAEDERRAEAAGARRRDFERHLRNSKRLQPATEPFKFGGIDAGGGDRGF
jgi:hypothetical protein